LESRFKDASMSDLFRLGMVLTSLVLVVSKAPGQTSKGSDADSGEKIYQRTLRSTVSSTRITA
jgi:hypothetical protein